MMKCRTAARLLTVLLLLPGLGRCAAEAQEVNVEAANTLGIARPSETIEVEWKKIEAAIPGVRADRIGVYISGKRLVSQTIDVNGDDAPDILLFQSDFTPRQRKAFVIKGAKKQEFYNSRTDARFVLPRQDLAWENDRIAFRIYGSVLAGDVNNGIDVWTKRVRSLIVEKWYRESEGNAPGKDSYHQDRGEGADFFSVGKSLGAGSCGIFRDGHLYQPGLFSSHRIIATGPIRALFEVTYDSGVVGGGRYREVKRISLDAGGNLNRVDVTYTGLPEGELLTVAAGVVKRKNTKVYADSAVGWIALWGQTNDDSINGSLGTGVVMPRRALKGFRETDQHMLIMGAATSGRPFTYYTGAGWTRSGDFRREKDWCAYLARFARRLQTPVKIRLITPAMPVIPRM
jgi:pectinesterase